MVDQASQTIRARARRIVLFSDGTGNSSGKLFKTNVYRMYEAVQLGMDPDGAPVQVAYYDNGVGTQSIRALAMFAGVFGWGLKANILRLYRFACRNANDDCEFYCFGFSRGAFTIRLVVAMLAQYGVVKYDTEEQLEARSADVFRAFMRTNNPNVAKFVGKLGRLVRDGFIAAKRAVFGPRSEGALEDHLVPARVRFIGVWDTVAAYGGPIVELTRGIDAYLWPLSMTDGCLNAKVEFACHALSIDEERDAFQPVLWDEVDWAEKARCAYPRDDQQDKRTAFQERMKQVWFAGVHSDVGGGYPDPSLSYVSLVWMMDEAEKAGLRLLAEQKKLFCDQSNSLGPIHDSRAGIGAYYRPQPRKIAAYLDRASGMFEPGMDLEVQTLSLRDPVLGEKPAPPHGLLLECRVHESVAARLVAGTDDYAPIGLPPRVSIEPYPENLTGGHPVVDPSVCNRLRTSDRDWYERQERIWDAVFRRRQLYFATIAVTLALVSMPLWAGLLPMPSSPDNRGIMQRLTSWSAHVPVGPTRPWITAFETNFPVFVVLAILAGLTTHLGGRVRRETVTRSYQLWLARLHGREPPASAPPPGAFTRFRISAPYQRIFRFLKWRTAPFLAAVALAVTGAWLALILVTQTMWSFAESRLCRASAAGLGSEIVLDITKTCQPLAQVQRGHRYQITIEERQAWSDDGIPATPLGVRNIWSDRRVPFVSKVALTFGMPLRRIVDANYLQPAVKLRPFEGYRGLVPRNQIAALRLAHRDGSRFYTAIFEADYDGDLSIFVNDAALPGMGNAFYANNRGTATVRIVDLDQAR